MADTFIGDVRLFAGDFAPVGWALCQGQVLSIGQYSTLFNLIGTTYGGDGVNTFELPDLRGRVPIHQGTGGGLTPRTIGSNGGSEVVTLTTAQIPQHTHALVASGNPAQPAALPGGSVLAATAVNMYGAPASQAMDSNALAPAGGNQPHENMAPFLAMTYIIALEGIFPSQN